MRVAVVGGGINGLCCAWRLTVAGYQVTLFEKNRLLQETSTASSKLLHGGVRYIEHGDFRLVSEALKERGWWLKNVPLYTNRLKFCIPIYSDSLRSWWKIKLGLSLYDLLSGKNNIGSHRRIPMAETVSMFHDIRHDGLKMAFTYFDGQMDEVALGNWVRNEAELNGAEVVENTSVQSISEDGKICLQEQVLEFDLVVNAAGPWAAELNRNSGIYTKHKLDLVRGSHIILDRPIEYGYLLEVPGENRVFFALPHQSSSRTLVGTTEVRQTLDEPITCSDKERDYLLSAYNHYFNHKATKNDIVESFAGVRPLLYSSDEPDKATREYALETNGLVITVLGGKWTTSRALANRVVSVADRLKKGL